MFENFILKQERLHHNGVLFLLVFALTLIFAVINSFAGGIALFLVAFVALLLAYPIVSYITALTKEEIERKYNKGILIKRHIEEVFLFWSIFLGATLGFLVATAVGLVRDFTYQQQFVEGVSGMIIAPDSLFWIILLNNLEVALLTFFISFLSLSALLFVILWNASLVAYYIFSQGTGISTALVGIALLPHGLLEIAGYIFAGLAGMLLAFRFQDFKKLNSKTKQAFLRDFSVLLIGSILFIILAATVEVL